MTHRRAVLSPVLFDTDLPPAELRAAELDGELSSIDEGWTPIDVGVDPTMRALALAAVIPSRLIAELSTAAWIHGARVRPPLVHEVCAPATSRYRDLGLRRVRLREVSISDDDLVHCGGLRVTSHLRTALDLLRCRDDFGPSDADSVLALAELGGLTLDDIEASLECRRHLPAKLRALVRLGELR